MFVFGIGTESEGYVFQYVRGVYPFEKNLLNLELIRFAGLSGQGYVKIIGFRRWAGNRHFLQALAVHKNSQHLSVFTESARAACCRQHNEVIVLNKFFAFFLELLIEEAKSIPHDAL